MIFKSKAKMVPEWRWRLALFPTRFYYDNWDTAWIWLEWYEVKGGDFDVYWYYRISNGEVFKYQTPSSSR